MDTKQLLIGNAKNSPGKPALIFRDETISTSALKDAAFRLASGLEKLGIEKQDKIAIYLPNCPQHVYSYLAAFCLGLCIIPLDFMLKEEEIISCLNHSGAKILIAKHKANIPLKEIKNKIATLEKIILIDNDKEGFLKFSEILNNAEPEFNAPRISEDDDSLILYTSGTSGNPKGVLLSYRHLSGSPEAMKYFVDLTEKDIKLCPLPLSHSAGLIYIQNCVVYNITLVLMERFLPIEFLRNIVKYKVTCFHIVPSMYYAISQLKEFEKYDLSSLRWMVVFGAPSAPEALARFHKYCPKTHLLNGWGLTETCPPNTVIPLGSRNIKSVGKPPPWINLRIVDDSDKELPRNAIGEITIKSWVLMKQYYKNPVETAKAIKNGWFHTGDLGRFDNEGFLYIVGRKKEMIKVSGQLVYAPEVEAAIHKHKDVIETAVIGVPDKLRGEAIRAFVIKDSRSDLSESKLRIFCRKHLARFKVPRAVKFVDTLPKNQTGKIDKETIKRSYPA